MAARLTALVVAFIVGVTLVAGLIVGAQRNDDSGPIDLLIFNGRVYTGAEAEPFAEALAIRGNRIYRVGSNREIKRLRHRATTVIDAHGGSVLPGFMDAHVRLPVASPPPAAGGDDAPPPSSAPSTAPGTLAGPAAQEPASRDAADLTDAVRGAHRLGVTGVSTVLETLDDLRAFEEARTSTPVTLRVAAALRVTPPLDPAALARLDAARRTHASDPLFRVNAVALRATVETAPRATPGTLARPQRRVEPHVPALAAPAAQALADLDQRGWTVVLQVEDEQELAAAMDALARVIDTNPAPASGRRHRIELARPMALDLQRLNGLGVAVALPLTSTWAFELSQTSGEQPPAADQMARTEVPPAVEAPADSPSDADERARLRLVVASESLADPRLGLQALVAGALSGAVADSAAAPVAQTVLAAAIDAYTRTAAWASGDERRLGTIAEDMLADLVILSTDVFTLAPDKLLDAVITVTVFDGKVVYDREAEEQTN